MAMEMIGNGHLLSLPEACEENDEPADTADAAEKVRLTPFLPPAGPFAAGVAFADAPACAPTHVKGMPKRYQALAKRPASLRNETMHCR